MSTSNQNVLTYEGLQYFYSKLSNNLVPPSLIETIAQNSSKIEEIQGQLSGIDTDLSSAFLKRNGSNNMTGNLTISTTYYPSVFLTPSTPTQANKIVFEGSYVGSASFGVWEDVGGSNRRILEVNSKGFKNSLDDAVYLRVAENNVYTSYRIFHEGMTSGIPIENGGTGASSAITARTNLLVNGTNPISSDAEDTNSYWGSLGGISVSYFNSFGQLNEQPSQIGALINCSFQTDTNLSYQLWGAIDGQLYHRNSTESGWNNSWIQILDESNFSSVISLTSLGGVSYTTVEDLSNLL